MDKFKIIKVSHGMRKQMMEVFSTTYPTLRAALSFESNTDKAELMRHYALEHGGILLESSYSFTNVF